MPQTRKKVRDALVAVLRHATRGFNARLAALAGQYGVEPFAIDWNPGSTSVFQGYLTSTDVEIGQLSPDEFCPCGVVIYTTTTEAMALQKPSAFSGQVGACVDFYIRFREGIEQDDTESIMDAVEDAAVSALYDDAAAWPPNVTLSAHFVGAKEPARLVGDGWQERLSVQLTFEVTA